MRIRTDHRRIHDNIGAGRPCHNKARLLAWRLANGLATTDIIKAKAYQAGSAFTTRPVLRAGTTAAISKVFCFIVRRGAFDTASHHAAPIRDTYTVF
jgi:hypothetical protein